MKNLAALFETPATTESAVSPKYSAIAAMVNSSQPKAAVPAAPTRPDPFAKIANAIVNSELVGGTKMTVNDVRNEVQHALNTDARFKQSRTNETAPTGVWIIDMLLPDESGWWTAIVSKDSLNYKVGFKIDANGHATLSPLPPMETKMIYNSATAGANAEVISAADQTTPQEAVNKKTTNATDDGECDGNEKTISATDGEVVCG